MITKNRVGIGILFLGIFVYQAIGYDLQYSDTVIVEAKNEETITLNCNETLTDGIFVWIFNSNSTICSASCSEGLDIAVNNSMIVGNFSQLNLTIDSPQKAGDYFCIAINDTTAVVSSTFRLFIIPFITAEETTFEQGGEFNLTCSTAGGVNHSDINWSVDGVRVTEDDIVSITTTMEGLVSTSILRVSAVDAATHKGLYKCFVYDSHGDAKEGSVTITVSPVGVTSVTPTLTIASKGDNVTLYCDTNGGPDNMFIWFHNISSLLCLVSNCSDGIFGFQHRDEDISSKFRGNSSTLNLSNVDYLDGGEFVCVVMNDAGIEISFTYLNLLPTITSIQDTVEYSSVNTESDESFTFTCEAEGYPDPVYQWQRLDPDNHENGFQNIENEVSNQYELLIVYEAAGSYRCVASNTINGTLREAVSDRTIINVSPLNSINLIGRVSGTEYSSQILVNQGDSFQLICSAKGGPNNAHTWTHSATEIPAGSLSYNISSSSNDTQSESVLSVTSVDAITHQGLYECTVMNQADPSENAPIQVIVSPEDITETSPKIIVAEKGDDIEIQCLSDATISERAWKFSSDVNNDNGIILTPTSQILTINGVTVSKGGNYTCIAENTAGEGQSSTIVYVKPYITQHPVVDLQVQYYDPVELSCGAEHFSDEPLTTTWQKQDAMGGFNNVASEMFAHALIEDSGVYRCVVSSVINSTTYTATSNTSTLTVHPISPNVSFTGDDVYVLHGQGAEYTCVSEGGPNNYVTWMKDGEPLEPSGNLKITTNIYETSITSTVNITSVDAKTHQGTYSCAVNNTGGSDTKSFTLTVSPENILYTTPTNITTIRGQNVTFNCDTDAGPGITYVWFYKIGSICEFNESVCVQSYPSNEEIRNRTLSLSKVLHLENVTAPDDGGEYTCVAVNDAGIEIINSTLNFLPQFTEEPADIVVESINIQITLRCRAEAYPPPTYQWQKKSSTGQYIDVPNEMGEDLVITSVDHIHAGLYRCVVSNVIYDETNTINSRIAFIHVSPNNTAMLSVTTSGGEYQDNNLYIEQGQNFSINCSASGGPDNTHIWKHNGVTINDSHTYFSISYSIIDTMSYSIMSVNDVIASVHKGSYVCDVINEAGDHLSLLSVHVSPARIVSTQPQSPIRTRSEQVTFQCSTDAGPDNLYYWLYKPTDLLCSTNCSEGVYDPRTSADINATVVGKGIHLVLSAPLEGGEYTCVVINDAGVELSTSTLNIPVEFVTHPESMNVTNGTSFNLTCIAEAYPYPSIQWQKMNRTTESFEDIPGETNTDLEFSPTHYDDYGIYRCIGSNMIHGQNYTDLSEEALVSVSPEGSVTITPNNATHEFEDNVVLVCDAQGGPHNEFQWFLNDSAVVSGTNNITIWSTYIESTLTISSLNAPDHGGTYKCLVSNEAGFEEYSTMLFVAPYITEQPQSVLSSQPGLNKSIIVKAKSFPSPRFTWMSISNISGSHGDVVGQPQPVLEFTPVEFGDEGYYHCHVSNGDITVISETTTVNVAPTGSVSVSPSTWNSVTGGHYEVNCSSMGGLNNTYEWFYTRTNLSVSNEYQLTINSSHAMHGGSYKCVVSNPAGIESDLFTLNVAPMILESPISKNYTIFSEDILLNCTVSGYPIPQVTWFHNNSEVDQNRSQVTITTYHMYESSHEEGSFGRVLSELEISSANVNDTGMYHCVVGIPSINEYSDKSSDMSIVLVQDVPDAPHSLSSDEVFSRNLTLYWNIPHDNNAPILGYYVSYNNPSFIDGGRQVVIKLEENTDYLFIEELHPWEYYDFIVLAYNEEGNSSRSEGHRVRTFEEEPDGPPQNVTAYAVSATEIIVKWEPLLVINRLGNITSYDVMYTAVEVDHVETVTNIKDLEVLLTDLHEYTRYNISVRGRTEEGPGPFSDPVSMVLTHQSAPGRVDPPSRSDTVPIRPYYMILQWSPPADANGIILDYRVEIDALQYNHLTSSIPTRRKRQSNVDFSLAACYQFLQLSQSVNLTFVGTSANISTLPFVIYQVRVSARTEVGLGEFSNYTYYTTPKDVPGVIVDLKGASRNATSIIIQWSAPPCPNGPPVSNYYVYYRKSTVALSSANIDGSLYTRLTKVSDDRNITMIVSGLTPSESYSFHVRAFRGENETGYVDREIVVKINTQINLTAIISSNGDPMVLGVVNEGAQALTISLPSTEALASVGITNIQFYGVIAIPTPDDSFMLGVDEFDTVYPDIQPYSNKGDKRYYIAAAWNNMSLIPSNFEVGDKTWTTAYRGGIKEDFYNKELKRYTDYCFYVVIHHQSEVGNEIVVRYAELSCQKTERGYSLGGLIIGLILVFLLILILIILLLLIICRCCRRQKYDFASKSADKKDAPSNMLIRNPAFQENKSSTVKVSEFPEYVEYMHSNGDLPFSEQFMTIKPAKNFTLTSSDANRLKNRNKSISSYDHSRVVLKDPPTESDYINANYMKGCVECRDFIAAQGPMETTVNEFWTMIWEQNITTIVMLTSLEENRIAVCYKYWPDLLESEIVYGSVNVKMVEETDHGVYVERTFTISKEDSAPKKVHHLQMTTWSDKKIPKSPIDILEFVEEVKKCHSNWATSPLVVHCSTGVGRTGMFIALLAQFDRASKANTVDVHEYIQYMFKQRKSILLSEDEYIFIHDVLVEAIKQGMIEEYHTHHIDDAAGSDSTDSR